MPVSARCARPTSAVVRTFCWTILLTPIVASSHADVLPHGGMMRYPDVSASQIVFVYANDIWVVSREGGQALPLASPPGQELFPKFSPDGQTIGFVGNYDGDRDLYTIAANGGVPVRVTHHPAGEALCEWSPDGRLIYSSNGMAGLQRQAQLFTTASAGGLPNRLPVPYGANGTISPDGDWLAYTPHSIDNRTWKRYRGGMATDIWLFNLRDNSSKKITDWEGLDSIPMWHGTVVYYLSDAGPEHRLNIWSFDTASNQRKQVTTFSEFDVRWPSIGPGPGGRGEIVFQYGPQLYLLDLANNQSRAIEVMIPGDRPTIRSKSINAADYIQAWAISSTGKRAAIEGRGDLWTSPAEKGAPRNLTRTDHVAERDPAWSPDGRWIAYFSDATGEYELSITQSDGKGETRQLTTDSNGYRYNPVWSPDSKHIVFSDKTGSLFIHTIEGGQTKLIDKDPWITNQPIGVSWSHDNRWIAYARTLEPAPSSAVFIYNVETGESTQATSGMFGDASPVFDRKGDYLYFTSSRSFQPTYSDLDTTFIYAGSQVILAVPLRTDMEHVWAPKSDEESWKDEKKEGDQDKDDESKDDDADGDKPAESGGDDDDADEKDDNGENGNGEGNGDDDDDADEKDEAAPAKDDGVSGTWEGTANTPEGPVNFTLTITMTEVHTVSGSITSPMGSGAVTGTFDPASSMLELDVAITGGPSVHLSLKIDGNTATGTGTADGEAIPVTANRTVIGSGGEDEDGEKDKDKKDDGKPREKVEIAFEGFESRAFQLPIASGSFGRLAVNDSGHLIYSRNASPGSTQASGIYAFDLKDEKKEEKSVAAGAGAFDISSDGKKLLVIRGNSASIQNASPGATGKNVITAGMSLEIDPRDEWKQLFTEAWRLQRDFFYVSNLHGVDWPAIRSRYEQMLDDCVTREDVAYVISEMISELNVGHAYYFGGDFEPTPSVSVGMLGCDFALENGAYRITTIHRGAPWDSDSRGPLSLPGVNVKEGEYLLEVNGQPLDVAKDPWAPFVRMAGQVVSLTISDKPTKDDTAREILVEPVSNEGNLRYRAWIERNRQYVDEKSSGQVGYIYVPDTGINGQNNLFRQFYGQVGKKALIIDERWNGGGQIPTRFIELLNRPRTNYWARRDGKDWPWPPDSHQGPKCMLINGLAGSGGDMFPWLFKQSKLGPTIGMRTWGGLVGISGNPQLIDGAGVTVPTFGFYETDGTWGVEGHGVDPDVVVVDDPALMTDGGDPQLDKAIELMLKAIAEHPYSPPQRPGDPDRKGMGINKDDQ